MPTKVHKRGNSFPWCFGLPSGAHGGLLAALLVTPVLIPRAGAAENSYPTPPWRIGAYVGGARHSPVGGWGVIPDRDHFIVGVRGATTVLRFRWFSLAYAPEVVPLIVVTNNPKYASETRRVGNQFVTTQVERGRGPVVGAGLAPFGLEADFQLNPRWRAYGAAAVGCLWFTREVPIARSRDFNYTWESGGGLLWEYRAGRWLQFGYKFHHLSNLDSAPENPGLDAHMFYLGWQRLFHTP